MSYDRIDVRPIAGALGADVFGVDLARCDDNSAWSQIHQAFLEFKVLSFRDQALDNDGLMDVGRRFGEPSYYPFVKGLDTHPFLFEIVKEPADTKNFGGGWHSDTTYQAKPPLATLLYALETPERGGDTLFADTAAAYEALSDGMKTLLAPLKGVNSAGLKHSGGRTASQTKVGAMAHQNTDDADAFEGLHPIVRTHPDTGRKSLYVSRAHTIRIEGLTEQESQPIIDFLQAHIVRPEFTCRVRWTPGTLTVWDNRVTQHSAINDYNGQRRRMRRLTVGGQVPF